MLRRVMGKHPVKSVKTALWWGQDVREVIGLFLGIVLQTSERVEVITSATVVLSRLLTTGEGDV